MSSPQLPFDKKDLRVDIETSGTEGCLVRITHLPTGESEFEDCVQDAVTKAISRVAKKLYKKINGDSHRKR